MTQPAPVFFYIFSAAVRLRYSWQVHSYYGGKEDDLSYTFSSFCTGCIHAKSILIVSYLIFIWELLVFLIYLSST